MAAIATATAPALTLLNGFRNGLSMSIPVESIPDLDLNTVRENAADIEDVVKGSESGTVEITAMVYVIPETADDPSSIIRIFEVPATQEFEVTIHG